MNGMMQQRCGTLVELLCERAQRHPDRIAYTFLMDGERQENIRYGELEILARKIGGRLQQLVPPGERVLLVFPNGLEFISAFFGCLFARTIAVPAYPPNLNRFDGKLKRFESILRDCAPRCILSTSSLFDRLHAEAGKDWEVAHWVQADTLDDSFAQQWVFPASIRDDVAFLQYTSGSTASPKGVMVTHDNIMQNEWMIQERCGHDENSTFVGWLPLYHDMGLIGNVLQPMYVGSLGVLMSPVMFLQQPIRWLQAISKFQATTSGGPNFSYDLCVYKTEAKERAELDLRSWRVAFNGAEPVRKPTMERFAKTFEAVGFRRCSFFPCYGLAEATLIVSGRCMADAPASPLEPCEKPSPASSGHAVVNTTIVIVDPETRQLSDSGTVGEIWVQSPSVARGYWNNSELTNATFAAQLLGQPGFFLRTGDLGVQANGELTIAGRLKDLIIVRGQNYYAEDIEFTAARSQKSLASYPGAAFTVEAHGAEELVIVQGVDRSAQRLTEIAEEIRNAIAQQHGLRAHTVMLVDPAAIPRTSSGKVQRHLCRIAFLSNSLKVQETSTLKSIDTGISAESIEAWCSSSHDKHLLFESIVTNEFAKVVQMRPELINPKKPLAAWGLDSLGAAQLEHQLAEKLHVAAPAPFLLSGISLEELVRHGLQFAFALPGNLPEKLHDFPLERIGDGPPVASFEQERLWLLSRIGPRASAYNLVVAVDIQGELSLDILRRSLRETFSRHRVLRSRFQLTRNQVTLSISLDCTPRIVQEDVENVPTEKREAIKRRYGLEESAQPFHADLDHLIRFKVLRFGAREHILLVTSHHAIMDAESLRILVDEVTMLYETFSKGKSSPLKDPALQMSDFARWQRNYVSSSDMALHISYWKNRLVRMPAPPQFPFLSPDSTAGSRDDGQHEFAIGQEIHEGLVRLAKGESATLFMTLLAAWNSLIFVLTEAEDIVIGSPITGRDLPQTRDLIGCFAYPLLLRCNVSGGWSFRELLQQTKKSVLEAYEHRELPFSKIVEMPEISSGRGENQLFNQMLSLIKVPQRTGSHEGAWGVPRALRATMDINLFVTLLETGTSFCGIVCYDSSRFDAKAIQQLMNSYIHVLERCSREPDLKIDELRPMVSWNCQKNNARSVSIAVAGDCAVEPLLEPVGFWLDATGIEGAVKSAPNGQVIQQLLDRNSLLARNQGGVSIILVRWDDKTQADQEQLLDALRSFQTGTSSPVILGLLPSKYGPRKDELPEGLADLTNVYLISADEILRRYPVDKIYDEFSDRLAEIPFTNDFYVAAATAISRKIRALYACPYKVIVLDCDQTLWAGLCAEDGVQGVCLDAPRCYLQEFMLQQKQAGLLLCLCSKNSEEDVAAVFDAHPEMPLKPSDFVSQRINWKPKWENIRSLAEELDLDLSSFIYLDDNPLECADVRNHCPEVLTLCLPQDAADIPRLLDHAWCFDHAIITAEDLRKTDLYNQDRQRRAAQRSSLSMQDFINGLSLEIHVSPLQQEEAARVAQLSHRVNQFNLTQKKYSRAELLQSCVDGSECLTVTVRDRFGHYGLVGAVVFTTRAKALCIEAFFLSCRALGRGVEHKLLSAVGRTAVSRAIAYVEIPFRKSQRNLPAREFCEKLNAQLHTEADSTTVFTLEAESTAAVVCDFTGSSHLRESGELQAPNSIGDNRMQPLALSRIAEEFRTVGELARLIHRGRSRQSNGAKPALGAGPHEPRTATEAILAAIWKELLASEMIDVTSDFFALGGNSLLAVQGLSRIWDKFQVEIPLEALFGGELTIERIARMIERLAAGTAEISVIAAS